MQFSYTIVIMGKKKKKETRFEIVIGRSLSFYRGMEIGRDTRVVEFFIRGRLGKGHRNARKSPSPSFFFNWPFDNYRIPARLSQLLLNYASHSRFNPVGLHFSRCCRQLDPRNFVRVRVQASILPR